MNSDTLTAGALGGLSGAFAKGRQEKAPGDFFINQPRLIYNARHIKDSLLLASRQGEKAMEPLKAALIALIVVGVVCLGVLLLGNKNLCDVSFRSGGTEIVAHMAYVSR